MAETQWPVALWIFRVAKARPPPYLGAMGFFSRLNPKEGVSDFVHEFSRPNPYRWRILAVSGLMTFTLIFMFTQEGVKGPPPPPDVTYITSFAPDRSDAEILAGNIANQRRKDQLEVILAEREERKRELYRTLGEVSGMDVEEIERQGALERQAEAEEAQRIRDVMLGRVRDIPEDVKRQAEEVVGAPEAVPTPNETEATETEATEPAE